MIWLEFPPNRLTALRASYLAKVGIEEVQETPLLDATGTRMLIGSSRITYEQATDIGQSNAPWLVIHIAFPSDWDYAET